MERWPECQGTRKILAKQSKNSIQEYTDVINSHPELQNIALELGSPEYVTDFDGYRNGRVNDFFICGKQGSERLLIGVEAKVDEEFGEIIGEYYLENQLKKINDINTNAPARIENLIKALFKKPVPKGVFDLRYQLFHAVAGLLAEAKRQNAKKTILMIHIFKTEDLQPEKYKSNMRDLDQFVKIISNSQWDHLSPGTIIGPVRVPGNQQYIPGEIPLYIGEIES